MLSMLLAKAKTVPLVDLMCTSDQLAPLSVERKIPPTYVPAKRIFPPVPLTGTEASVMIVVVAGPAGAADHVHPSSVDRYNPLLSVPAKMLVPLATSACTRAPDGPPVCVHCEKATWQCKIIDNRTIATRRIDVFIVFSFNTRYFTSAMRRVCVNTLPDFSVAVSR